uniref:Uncharacterized protein n=1 Tax=Anguilla anguilla TaxID=7936 RepID=A0A0E9T0E0_ANGAN
MQKSNSERTTCRTLKQLSYSSRRPHRVPLLSPNEVASECICTYSAISICTVTQF